MNFQKVSLLANLSKWFYFWIIVATVHLIGAYKLVNTWREIATLEDRLDSIFVVGECLEDLPKVNYYKLREGDDRTLKYVKEKFDADPSHLYVYNERHMVYYMGPLKNPSNATAMKGRRVFEASG